MGWDFGGPEFLINTAQMMAALNFASTVGILIPDKSGFQMVHFYITWHLTSIHIKSGLN
jgi:hypothetical protein